MVFSFAIARVPVYTAIANLWKWIQPRVGVLSWHLNSNCSLLVFLSLVPSCFSCFLFGSSRTARHLFVRALPNSSIRIHCIPSVAWDVRVTVGFFIEVEFFCNISFITWGMVFAHSSSSHPSSTRSSISSLCFSSFFGRRGGCDVSTSYHHCRIWGLLPAILIFSINNLSIEGNSVAASSSFPQDGEVDLLDFLEECFDRGEGVQGVVRARAFSPLFYFLQYLRGHSVHGFLNLPVPQGWAMCLPC